MDRVPIEKLNYPGDGLYYRDGIPFTGIACFVSEDGWVEADSTYREGMEWGPSRTWYAPGRLASEAQVAGGLLHGLRREWHENGTLAAEEMFELGVRIWGNRWDPEGNLIEAFQLRESDSSFRTLQEQRAYFSQFDWAGGPIGPAASEGQEDR